jgi:uncharacterized protein YdeI (YjbR/CyaY-like superfamily)
VPRRELLAVDRLRSYAALCTAGRCSSADLQEALGTSRAARAYFEGLSYTHQREYVNWIEEAKREATRRSRIEKAVTMLEQKRKAR